MLSCRGARFKQDKAASYDRKIESKGLRSVQKTILQAGFLIGAQRNQYFGVIGWHWNCAEIPAATLAPLCVTCARASRMF